MKIRNYLTGLFAVSLAIVIMSGCSSFVTVNKRAIQVEDVINMTKAGVGADVINRQIEVTSSRFELEPDQIIMLKKAGVDDKVIKAMIETGYTPERFDWEYGYSPSEYWFNYYNQWYPAYYYPRGYPTYSYYPYVLPYSVYRSSGLVGRFYRYVPPLYPPRWDYGRRRWVMHGECNKFLDEEEKK